MTVRIVQSDPSQPEIRRLIDALDEYQQARYPDESNHLDSIEELTRDNVYFIAAYADKSAIGCGAVKYHHCGDNGPTANAYAEVKRMFVTENGRGKGVSKLIMAELERHAQSFGVSTMRLETGIYQPEAIGLYQSLGYQRCDSFGDYSNDDPYSVFMSKELA